MGRLVEPARELSQHRERKREERERERHSQTAIKKASKQERQKEKKRWQCLWGARSEQLLLPKGCANL